MTDYRARASAHTAVVDPLGNLHADCDEQG